MVDVSVINGNAGVTLDQTGIGVIQNTLTATKYVTHRGASELHVARVINIIIFIIFRIRLIKAPDLVTTDDTVVDSDVGVASYFSNLTTAKDARAHPGGCTADGNLCAVCYIAGMICRTQVMVHRTHTAAIYAAVGVFHDTGFCNGGLHCGRCRNLGADGGPIFNHDLRTGNHIFIFGIFDRIARIVELLVVTLNGTYLTAAIDVTHNPCIGSADGQLGTLHIT